MYPHTIRLRGPWNYELRGEHGAQSGSISMPCVLPAAEGQTFSFTRGFNWLAKIDDDEAVHLYARGAVGRCQFLLNGQAIGEHQGVWGTARWDVTSLLRGRNNLTIESQSPTVDTLGFNPYGSLGPVSGVVGDVYLSVEHRSIAALGPLTLEAYASEQGGRLTGRLEVTADADFLGPHPLRVGVTLDGEPIFEQELSLSTEKEPAVVAIEGDNLPVQEWLPRRFGRPHLHELKVELRTGGVTVHQQVHQVGFRNSEKNAARASADISIVEVGPDRTLAPNTGESLTTPFAQWKIAQSDVLHIRDHIACEDFYKLCDRAGLAVVQDVPLTTVRHGWEDRGELADLVRRLSLHPCICEFRPSGDDQADFGDKVLAELLGR